MGRLAVKACVADSLEPQPPTSHLRQQLCDLRHMLRRARHSCLCCCLRPDSGPLTPARVGSQPRAWHEHPHSHPHAAAVVLLHKSSLNFGFNPFFSKGLLQVSCLSTLQHLSCAVAAGSCSTTWPAKRTSAMQAPCSSSSTRRHC
jgi:hypothetical protein